MQSKRHEHRPQLPWPIFGGFSLSLLSAMFNEQYRTINPKLKHTPRAIEVDSSRAAMALSFVVQKSNITHRPALPRGEQQSVSFHVSASEYCGPGSCPDPVWVGLSGYWEGREAHYYAWSHRLSSTCRTKRQAHRYARTHRHTARKIRKIF